MRSICLLGEQVVVQGKGWMVLAIDNYDYGILKFERKGCVQRNLDLNCVS